MALVSYSDSEASDSELETKLAAPTPAPASSSSTQFQSIVDRSNPRKIRVALPSLKPEDAAENEDGPARKKARLGGGGGGAFAGFNSFLPAPKRNATSNPTEKKAPARKIFSLKTGAAPGFDRDADAEMRNDQAFAALSGGGGEDDGFIPKAGSLRDEEEPTGTQNGTGEEEGVMPPMKKPEEVKLKGNPMMFKPLSVGRTQQKKRRVVVAGTNATAAVLKDSKGAASTSEPQVPQAQPVSAPAKPKISLFSLSSTDDRTPATTNQSHAAYEPLVYDTGESASAAGPRPESELESVAPGHPDPSTTATAAYSAQDQTLDNIADDLNLSRAQRRQLFGRQADSSAKSRILHFNTDREYAANQEMAHQDQASVQHNPVRAIAPGKHTLQQLVNSAQTQREALEESFASGKRNKKEAGARYGW